MADKNLSSIFLSSFSYLGSIADLRLPEPKFKSILKQDSRSDYACLQADWEQVGQYLYDALKQVDDEQQSSKKK